MENSDLPIATNLATVTGYNITEQLGIISGAIAPSKFILKDIMASFRQIFGAEMKEYTKMMYDSQQNSLKRLQENAKKLGADAVVNVRFMGTGISHMSAEMLAYGTAVKLEEISD